MTEFDDTRIKFGDARWEMCTSCKAPRQAQIMNSAYRQLSRTRFHSKLRNDKIAGPSNGIAKLRIPAKKPHTRLSMVEKSGIFVVALYFFRATVLPLFLHIPYSALIAANILVLILAVGFIVPSGVRWRGSWAAFALACSASLIQAEDLQTAITRCAGLIFLMITVGPIVVSSAAVKLRAAAWNLIIRGLPVLTVIYVAWYGLRLPNFGAGFFSTFMAHCMLLGPFAGMGVAIAWAHGLHERSWRWKLLGILGVIPVMASGSRIAILATLAAVCFLYILRKPALGFVLAIICSLGVFAFISQGRNIEVVQDSLTGVLANKGNLNSREDLWMSRIDEFKSSPLVGIGIAMGTGGGAFKDEGGSIRVEPGSSYLAILSMTGGLGTITFLVGLGSLLFRFMSSKKGNLMDRDILSAMGVFMGVHGIAEGWVISFGSPLCFLFWIWLGSLGDATLSPVRGGMKGGLRPMRRGGFYKTNLRTA